MLEEEEALMAQSTPSTTSVPDEVRVCMRVYESVCLCVYARVVCVRARACVCECCVNTPLTPLAHPSHPSHTPRTPLAHP